MADLTGPVKPATSTPFGRQYAVRRALLDTIEQALMRMAAEDGMDRLPSFCYDGMGGERVRVQLHVYTSEVAP